MIHLMPMHRNLKDKGDCAQAVKHVLKTVK